MKNYLILTIFFITGLTGLAYELIWIRLLILSFGSTQFAITTVLSIFMAGLALGSVVFGRLSDRYPYALRFYGFIEIFLGLYCLISPQLFSIARDFYLAYSPAAGDVSSAAWFDPLQFSTSFIVLIVPATLMGGTLPVLIKHIASIPGRIGYNTAVPYAVNTLGAVIGCLLTGLFAIFWLGTTGTLYLAGTLDIMAGALILAVFWKVRSNPRDLPSTTPLSLGSLQDERSQKSTQFIVLASFTISGFCSLAYEVLWTRVLSLALGSTVYAFTIMLATFLLGLALGSFLFAYFADRLKRPVLWFAFLEAVIGLFALFTIFFYRELPVLFFNLKGLFAERFWLFLTVQFLISSFLMIVPTVAIGAIFPVVNRIYSNGLPFNIGKIVGNVYFYNTSGSIIGSAAAGFLIIPVVGAQNGVIIIAGINILLSAILIFWSEAGNIKLRAILAATLAALFFVIYLILPPWERMAMTMGLYVNEIDLESKKASNNDLAAGERLLYYKEGLNAIITVRGSGADNAHISYQSNGKQEARSESGRPSWSWSILGHLPIMLHNHNPKDALLIGLGSGMTLGSMEQYPLRSIDVVELESGVVDAARFFAKSNFNALDDHRVRLHLTDGRSFLSLSRKKYDILVSGVSDPWISGVSNLFTYEYFKCVKDKLNDNGVAAVWFSNYKSTPEDFKTGLKSFTSAFPYVSVWFHYRSALDLVLIGSEKPHQFDMDRLELLFSDPAVKSSLSLVDLNTQYDLYSLFISRDNDLRRYIGEAEINTDERPILEFSLPRNMYREVSGADRVRELIDGTTDILPPIKSSGMNKIDLYLNAGKVFNNFAFRTKQAYKAFNMVLGVDPSNKEALFYADHLSRELSAK